ncbi:MAG: hypothetical protein FWD53_12245 [Phycisphaerales bacterium]|nr:hypothetical protein [Phycisphaerales bacterium]
MPRECLFCKNFLLADEPLIVYELKTTDWPCFMCGKCLPLSIDSVEQEVDGESRIMCIHCWEDYQEHLHGEAYLKQRESKRHEFEVATEKEDKSEPRP